MSKLGGLESVEGFRQLSFTSVGPDVCCSRVDEDAELVR